MPVTARAPQSQCRRPAVVGVERVRPPCDPLRQLLNDHTVAAGHPLRNISARSTLDASGAHGEFVTSAASGNVRPHLGELAWPTRRRECQ